MTGTSFRYELVNQAVKHKILFAVNGKYYLSSALSGYSSKIFVSAQGGEIFVKDDIFLSVSDSEIRELLPEVASAQVTLGTSANKISAMFSYACRDKTVCVSKATKVGQALGFPPRQFVRDGLWRSMVAYLVWKNELLPPQFVSKFYVDKGFGNNTPNSLMKNLGTFDSNIRSYLILAELYPHWKLLTVGESNSGDLQIYDSLRECYFTIEVKDCFCTLLDLAEKEKFLVKRVKKFSLDCDVFHMQAFGMECTTENVKLFKTVFENELSKEALLEKILFVTFRNDQTVKISFK